MIQQSRELDADTPKELSQHRRKSTSQTSCPSIKMKQVNTIESWKSRHRRSIQTAKLPSKRSRIIVSHDMDRHCEQSIELKELNEFNAVSTQESHRLAGSFEDCDSSRLKNQNHPLVAGSSLPTVITKVI